MPLEIHNTSKASQGPLKQAVTLPYLIFYGIGTMLGAGIYVLVGKIAGIAGMYTPLAFIVASALATFTALSFAELSARYPRSEGVVAYIDAAFHQKIFSTVVGVLVFITGIVSAATLMRGFNGYLKEFIQLPEIWVILGITLLMGLISFWGIVESLSVVAIITCIEVGGLIFVLIVAGEHFSKFSLQLPDMLPPVELQPWNGIIIAAFMAFYAFIGFEDLANVAEETRNPQRDMPRAIIFSLIIATVLYVLIAILAILALPVNVLSQSEAPLAEILRQYGTQYPYVISLISLFAVVNGALVQIIMGSRIIFGMAREHMLPAVFSRITPVTQTPWVSTLFTTLIIALLAISFPLVPLANTSSFLIICSCAMVNLSLVLLKRRSPHPQGIVRYPVWVPWLGLIFSVAFLMVKLVAISS